PWPALPLRCRLKPTPTRPPKAKARADLAVPISPHQGDRMLVIAGLGNPGQAYSRNRHNIGFMAVDEIARRWGFGPERSRFHGLAREGSIETPAGAVRALILKPLTYYNESGRAVGDALQFYKLTPADL